MKGLYPECNNLFFEEKQILQTNGCRGFQLFCTAFYMPMTGVALKVALGYKKIVFWAFQKNNHGQSKTYTWVFWAFWANKE